LSMSLRGPLLASCYRLWSRFEIAKPGITEKPQKAERGGLAARRQSA